VSIRGSSARRVSVIIPLRRVNRRRGVYGIVDLSGNLGFRERQRRQSLASPNEDHSGTKVGEGPEQLHLQYANRALRSEGVTPTARLLASRVVDGSCRRFVFVPIAIFLRPPPNIPVVSHSPYSLVSAAH